VGGVRSGEQSAGLERVESTSFEIWVLPAFADDFFADFVILEIDEQR
jgi:hypothetical protein